ncbi:ATP-binding protein [Desulfococcaceae bacterium HSG8]|nr:ATP-binding protein [Desulfococcaceae bacterium HSG8]
MINSLLDSNIAIVGGGKFCKIFLQFFLSENFADRRPKISGVADINEQAEGLQYAREMGIFTTNDYIEICRFKDLDVILELTHNPVLGEVIKINKSPEVKLIDHFEASAIWDAFQAEDLKINGLKELEQHRNDLDAVADIFKQMTDRFASIIRNRNIRSRKLEKELLENEQILSQIIQGSTIPTFVINKDHVIIHWNKAMEKFSDVSAAKVIGTNRQWEPFYGNERPTMADIILDQVGEEGIKKLYGLYGTEWRKSALIDGAYEAEGFFPKLGEDGKWCWFTAAPIKAPDGKIVGAIETLWDKTEDKKAEEDREHHTRELDSLCSIYAALNAPISLDERIKAVILEIKNFMAADSICIFFLREDGTFHLEYDYGDSEAPCKKNRFAVENSIICRVAESDEITIFEDLPEGTQEEIGLLEQEGLKSLAYIPISAKAKKGFGVIRIGSCLYYHFSPEEKHVLELIGNRIGAAVENTMLQEKYIKSEEKYRSLFNSNPNPIFIIDSKKFVILDTNQRAQDYYEYSRRELIGFPFLHLGDANDAEVINGLKSLSKNQSVLFSKKKHYRKGYQPFYVNINISYAEYDKRDVLIATTTDVTESIEKETQLIQAGKMATLGVMAAGMAHEINQPLNVIQVCADFFLKMLKKGKPISDEDLESITKDIVANVERATGVIKHVRGFARQSEVVRTKVNINDPINDVFKVLGHQLKIHQIEVELDLNPDLPEIMADHNRLEQVFINLVNNAIDAMDEKSRQSDTRNLKNRLTIKSFSENGRIIATVSDTGTGMPKEVIDKIFEPFFTTKKIGKGTGLGISISYGIVKDYEGTIEIESEVGKGTTFKISFPET